jgi:Ca-activated chloride channel homolog
MGKMKIKITPDLKAIPNYEEGFRIIRISLTAPVISEIKGRDPLNLGLVIDRSGSMGGDKIRKVKDASKFIVDHLNGDDRISIVSYSDSSSTHIKSMLCTAGNKGLIKSTIEEIYPSGTTNLSDGWLTGSKLVAASMNDSINHVFLLSDGLANRGITNLEELGLHSAELAKRGVRTSTFGVGLGFNEFLMAEIANRGQGYFEFIESADQIKKVFLENIEELFHISSKNVSLDINVPVGVEMAVQGSWEVITSKKSTKILLGNFISEEKRNVFVELKIPEDKLDKEIIFKLSSELENKVQNIKRSIKFSRVDRNQYKSLKRNQNVIDQYTDVKVGDLSSKALHMYQDGDRKGAKDYIASQIENSRKNFSVSGINRLEQEKLRMETNLSQRDMKESLTVNQSAMRSTNRREIIKKCPHNIPLSKDCKKCISENKPLR